MMEIYMCNLAKATGVVEKKIRPVVVISKSKETCIVCPITSRWKDDKFHVHMNNYLVHGYCDACEQMKVKTRYLLKFVRSCTISEETPIKEKLLYSHIENYVKGK